ncbi:7-methylxanthosine synthase 1 isoform X2 [Vigna radiata var. radiata]|uniref:7-methylxanthosine synthase 1 isoform X2 n=1 Tax=Vigna radiata var. radiata TaxID=3916 RepID=A0A1S3TVC1_VIGRR|nr:7-methylxanthosine synthase 1 isoform X2 [Vigna radiata var. radiata]
MERDQPSLHMNSGKGEMSYANNSSIQRQMMLKAKFILEETITRLYRDSSPNCMKVADLGCSVGPNTLLVISNIINMVDTACTHCDLPTFQFYLNDLFGNDFNTTIKLLPDFYTKLVQYKGHGSCFINITPGSFYGRLFPSNSINLFHSSNSLHWLSQDPLLECKDAASVNKGHCHIVSTSPPEVRKAYLKQYQQDFKLFLRSRSEELVPGGAMVLMHLGYHETPRRTSFEIVSLILNDMLMEEEESLFLERLEVVITAWDEGINIEGGDDDSFHGENVRVEIISKHVQAAMEPLLSEKFDAEVIKELFVRFQKKIMQIMKVEKLESATFVISITKKA